MTTDMANTDTGDADIDFAAGLIPHHQAAVAMAQIEMEFGTDPELRALAEAIIAAQETEIAQMEAWLAAPPMGPAVGTGNLPIVALPGRRVRLQVHLSRTDWCA